MEDRKNRQAVQRALDTALSGIQEDPWMAQRVLRIVHDKGGIVVKKRLSVGFILVLILLTSSIAALAWTLSRSFFEETAQLQFSGGYYDDWNVTEKQQMMDILVEHGLMNKADVPITEEAIDTFMIGRYGVDGRSDVIGLWTILEKELGAFETWSMEDQAWYTQMLIDSGLQTAESDESVYALPQAQDIQPDEALAIAKAAICKAFALDNGALDQLQVEMTFRQDSTDEEPHYDISFRGEGYADFYSCSITRSGQIMDSSMGEAYLSPAEQVEEKRKFLLENDLEISKLFMQYAQEHITGDFNFTFWPLEDKQTVTDMLRPIILEHMAENPNYADQLRIYWATHVYGLPDERAISQQQAVETARTQLTGAFGLTDEQAALVDKVGLFYEITDPANPLWKITLCVGETREAAAEAGLDLSVNYRVVLNAYTGEVIETYDFTEIDDARFADIAMAY